MTAPLRPDLTDALAGISARAAGHDADGSFPAEAFDALWREGALNLVLPVESGGAGARLEVASEVVQTVGEADASVALVLAQHFLMHGAVRRSAWPEAVRRALQQSSVEGVALVNALRVEPELGTPARGGLPTSIATRLPGDSGWSLSGTKIYSTAACHLRWMLVWARSDDADPLVGWFVVDAHSPGIRIERTWDSLGMRATRSDDVTFVGVELPFDHAVDVAPASATANRSDLATAAWNSILMTAVYHGVARAARTWLAGYLNERTPSNLGAPLASLPRFQEAFGRIESRVVAGDRLLRAVAADVDAATDADLVSDVAGASPRSGGSSMGRLVRHANLVKHTVTNGAIDIVLDAVRLIGNPGLARMHPLERHLRDVLHGRVHTPQDDTILLDAGRSALDAAARRRTGVTPGSPT